MTPKEREELLNELIRKSAEQFEGFTDVQMAYAIKRIQSTIALVIEALEQAENENNEVKKERLQKILDDLTDIQFRIMDEGSDAFDVIITRTAQRVAGDVKDAMEGAGVPTVGIDFNRVDEYVFKYITQRFADDGLVLSDRIWNLTEDLRLELEEAITNGILTNQDRKSLIASVRKVYDNETWKIDRLVRTEVATAQRVGFGYSAEESEVVDYVRIVRGEADKPTHECTIYSKENPYGEGEGVFKTTDTKIYNPHPNCTSYLLYVINYDKVEQAVDQREDMQEAGMAEPEIDEAEQKLFELRGLDTKGKIQRWAERNLDIADVDLREFEIEYAKATAEQLFLLKQRYPEAMSAKLDVLADSQRWMRETYDDRVYAVVEHNLNIKGLPLTPENIAKFTPLVKKAKQNGKLIVQKRVDPKTNAFATSGYRKHNGIFMNKNKANLETMRKQREYTKSVGWHATSAPIGTMTHEYGHIVDYWLRDEDPVLRNKFVDDMWDELTQGGARVAGDKLSRYGATKKVEMFAEAFAEYIHEGDNARPFAKKFGKELDDIVDRIRKAKGGN